MEQKIKYIDPYDHPPEPAQPKGQGYGNNGILDTILALNVGAGENAFYVDQQGMWLGGRRFSTAPFSVSMAGLATFNDQTGRTIIDPSGLKSDTQFLSSTIEDFTDRTTAITTPSDIPFTTVTFSLPRPTNIIVTASVCSYLSGLTGGDAGAAPLGNVQLKIDGVLAPFKIKVQDVRMYTPEIAYTTSRVLTQSYTKLFQLAPGPHTINLSMFLSIASSYVLHVLETSLCSVTLGK